MCLAGDRSRTLERRVRCRASSSQDAGALPTGRSGEEPSRLSAALRAHRVLAAVRTGARACRYSLGRCRKELELLRARGNSSVQGLVAVRFVHGLQSRGTARLWSLYFAKAWANSSPPRPRIASTNHAESLRHRRPSRCCGCDCPREPESTFAFLSLQPTAFEIP